MVTLSVSIPIMFPSTPEVLAINDGLRAQPQRPAVDQCNLGAQRQRRSAALDGELRPQIDDVAVDRLGARDDDADVGEPLDVEVLR
jgi:hypothetical protein